jgi:hypothetical protein
MSPEQVGGKEVDFRSDLYSLGCLLHELLTGAPPYDSERALTVLFQQVNDPPPPLPKVLPCGEAPTAGAIALHSALLAKSREARPSSTESVAEALANVADGKPVSFETKATLPPGVFHLITAEPIAAPARSKTARNVALVLGVAAVSATLVMTFPSSSEPIPPPSMRAAPAMIAAPAMVQLTLETEPAGAAIAIDGEPRGVTPQRIETAASGGTKTIRFSKAGYLSVEQRVTADLSHAIRVVLQPEPKKESSAAKPQRKLKTTR